MEEYKVVELEEKTIIGIYARTSNDDIHMQEVIGGLWKRFFEEGFFSNIPEKVNGHTIGLYSEYENNAQGKYNITVGCEVSNTNKILQGTVIKKIPAGKYAEFKVEDGDCVSGVSAVWEKTWKLPLKRTYTGDFEEYFDTPEGNPGEIRVYVAIE